MFERINLVPAKPISAKLKRTTPLAAGLLLGVILLFLGGRYFLLDYRLDKTVQELAGMESQITRATQFQVQERILSQEIVGLNKQVVDLKGEVARISGLRQEKRIFSKVLTRIAEALPASVKCSTISMQQNTGAISGMALQYKDLPDFVDILQNDALFKKATLHDIDRGQAAGGSRFSYKILFELN